MPAVMTSRADWYLPAASWRWMSCSSSGGRTICIFLSKQLLYLVILALEDINFDAIKLIRIS